MTALLITGGIVAHLTVWMLVLTALLRRVNVRRYECSDHDSIGYCRARHRESCRTPAGVNFDRLFGQAATAFFWPLTIWVLGALLLSSRPARADRAALRSAKVSAEIARLEKDLL